MIDSDDLAGFADEFGETVTFTPSGGVAVSLAAIRYDTEAPDFQGPGASMRRVIFELPAAGLAASPAKGDGLVDSTAVAWRVIDKPLKVRDALAWQLTVEKVAP